MDDDVNIVYGFKPTVSVYEGTAGEQIYEALVKHKDLKAVMISAETKESISYWNLLKTSTRLAQVFLKHGFTQNTVVGIFSENRLEYMYPVLAGLYVGMIIAPVNPEYIKHELYHAINLSKPEIVFCSMQTLSKVRRLKEELSYLKKVIVFDLDRDIEGVQSFDSFLNSDNERFLDAQEFRPIKFDCSEQVALILCSSGTTGLPKGVMVTHRNLVYRLSHSLEPDLVYIEPPGTVALLFLPTFHATGLYASFELYLLGYTIVSMKKFQPRLYLECIQEYKIKCLRLVPPIIVFLAKSPMCSEYDLSSLEDIRSGAAPLSKEVEASIQKRFGKKLQVRQCYGLTETTIGVMYNPIGKNKQGSSGLVVPHMAVKVVDVETMQSLEAEKPGEIWIKGPLVAKGYINDPNATAETFLPTGWLRSGDIGYYDKEGYFFIIDRLKELIKYKGFQVAPAEIEAVLLKHPKIRDAGVIGIPDERAGELPAAFVCIKDGQQLTEQAVIKYISEQVSPQKQLRGGVYFISEIPRNASGKVLRRKLRELIAHKPSKM